MIESKEKIFTSPKAEKDYKESLIDHIFELTYQRAHEKSQDRIPTNAEIKEEFRSIMDEYEKADRVRNMLGINTHEDWVLFFDEVSNLLIRKLSESQTEAGAKIPSHLRSEDLTQKNLFE